jgi:hypothetical protein
MKQVPYCLLMSGDNASIIMKIPLLLTETHARSPYFSFHPPIVENWVSRALISSHVIGPILDPHNIAHIGLKTLLNNYTILG